MEIKILEITDMAMSESLGLELRKKIQECLNESEIVIMDFDKISLFATPFFNASIGFLYMHLTPEVNEKRIFTKNLSSLGSEIYTHSLENAEDIYNHKIHTSRLGKIVEDSISNT